jgi:Tol biopolymer transport system component
MLSRITAVLASTLLCVLVLVAPAQATFPGKNGKIAFDSDRVAGQGIYTMNPDGSGTRRLVPSGAQPFGTPDGVGETLLVPVGEQPVWAAEGTRFVFANNDTKSIAIADADGGHIEEVCTFCLLYGTGGYEPPYGLAWSPDGARIVYTHGIYPPECRHCPPSYPLFIISADGSNLTRLTYPSNADAWPDWSPDGSKIALLLDSHGIGTVNPDGTGWVFLDSSALEGTTPSWSPDGTRLAFATHGNDPVPCWIHCNFEIYTMNADGSNPIRLTNNSVPDLSPVWSPDGTKIAFASRRDGNTDIYSMNADGSGQTRLTTDPAGDFNPDWQPLPAPQRSDYKNSAKFCKAERDFLGAGAFRQSYGGGANAYGKCVSQNH